jgi:hypothetical protein
MMGVAGLATRADESPTVDATKASTSFRIIINSS